MHEITAGIWQKKDVSPAQKLILLAIVNEKRCTVKIITDKTGMSDKWVRKCIHDLQRLQLLHSKQEGQTNVISINAEQIILRTEFHTKHENHRTEFQGSIVQDRTEFHTEQNPEKTDCHPTRTHTHTCIRAPESGIRNPDLTNILLFKKPDSTTTRAHTHAKADISMHHKIISKNYGLTYKEREANLYRALFAFKQHIARNLGITLIDDERTPYKETGGRLATHLEVLWRKTLSAYVKNYKVNFDVLLTRLDNLGRYIGKKGPFHLRDRKMSFEEFLTSKNGYFDMWMAEALSDASLTNKLPVYQSMPIKTLTPEEENQVLGLIRDLSNKLGGETKTA